MEKSYWQPRGNLSSSIWTEVNNRQKKKKITPREPRSYEADLNNMRETMCQAWPY